MRWRQTMNKLLVMNNDSIHSIRERIKFMFKSIINQYIILFHFILFRILCFRITSHCVIELVLVLILALALQKFQSKYFTEFIHHFRNSAILLLTFWLVKYRTKSKSWIQIIDCTDRRRYASEITWWLHEYLCVI